MKVVSREVKEGDKDVRVVDDEDDSDNFENWEFRGERGSLWYDDPDSRVKS